MLSWLKSLFDTSSDATERRGWRKNEAIAVAKLQEETTRKESEIRRLIKVLQLRRIEQSQRNAHASSLPPITLASPACPYCGVIQNPPPKRRKKCRDCGEVIHTRTDREARKKYLVTATQVEEHKREKAERKAAEKAEAERRRKESKHRARQQRNARWKELSQEVMHTSQAGDWRALSLAIRAQAEILFVEGSRHYERSAEAQRFSLMATRDIGIPAVRVRTCQDQRVCEYCASLDGKVFTTGEALEQMPLPGPSCMDGSDENPHGGQCRCYYGPVFL